MDAGEALRHGVRLPGVDTTWRMPLGPLAESFLAAHATAPRVWIALTAALTLGTVFGLGALLGGTAGGTLAAAVALNEFGRHPVGPEYFKMFLYESLFLLAAAALAWRARKPDPTRSFVAGVALGATVLCRSPLIAFAPLLAALDIARDRRRWRSALLLAATPFLFLVPWAVFTHRTAGEISWMERGAATLNLATAAAGVDSTADGDARLLLSPERASATSWTVLRGALAEDPGGLARGWLRRARRALSERPLLVFAGLIALTAARRRPGAAELGLLAAYYLAVTCLPSISSYYFQPLWLLLAALAGGAAGTEPPREPSAALRPAAAALVLAVAGCAYASVLLLFPTRPTSASNHPQDPWLLVHEARQASARGDAGSARALLDRAERLAPHWARLPLERAWTAHVSGDDVPLLALDPDHPADGAWPVEDLRVETRAARALASPGKDATAELDAALASWRGTQKLPEARSPAEREILSRLRAGAEESLARRLLDAVEWRGGDAALLSLARAASPASAPRLAGALALIVQERRGAAAALPLHRRLADALPRDAESHKDLGVCAYLSGDKTLAARALRRAARLDPSRPAIALSLGAVLEDLGLPAEALAAYDAALRAPSGADAELALLRATRARLAASMD